MHGDPAMRPAVNGMTTPEFQPVRVAFERNFLERGELGAACAVFYRGTRVVDLWGGYRCTTSRDPWTEQTLALAFSTTKGMAAAAMAVAHSRGLFELDERVAAYWPEFAQSGKQDVTVRQLLAHQAGLVSIDAPLDVETLSDHDLMADILARQKPAWPPGAKHGYHTLTLGFYQSELIRRVDPQHRSIGRFFQDEIARPLDVEFYIGLPADIGEERIAKIKGFHRLSLLRHLDKLPAGMVLAGIWPNSLTAKSVACLRLANPAEIGGPLYRGVEIPSANGIGQARAVARIFGVLAGGGRELGISPRTMQELAARAPAPVRQTHDAILKMDTRYSFGFSRPSRAMQFGSSFTAFGCPAPAVHSGWPTPTSSLVSLTSRTTWASTCLTIRARRRMRDACYGCLGRQLHRRLAA